MTTIEAVKFFQGKSVVVLEQGSSLSKIIYEDTPDNDFWVKNTDLNETKQKGSISSKQDNSFTQYSQYETNKAFFDSNDFSSSLLLNPSECYWLVGWFKREGLLERHEPVLVDGEVVRRGATLHVLFPNPEFPGLDLKSRGIF